MKKEDKTYYKRLAIVCGIILAVLIVVAIITIPKPGTPVPLSETNQLTKNLEKTDVEFVQSSLGVYYAKNRSEHPIGRQSTPVKPPTGSRINKKCE